MAEQPINVLDVTSLAAFDAAVASSGPVVAHFWAAWCEPCKHMDTVLAELAKLHAEVKFLRVEAEEVPEVSEKYEISAVPTFLAFKGAKLVQRLEGADAAAFTAAVEAVGTAAAPTSKGTWQGKANRGEDESYDVRARIAEILAQQPVVLFMKGTPDAPRCGFSSKVVGALESLGARFGTYDVLSDESVRQGVKAFSDWPTFPQLYVNAELLGGCDIVTEMAASGELRSALEAAGALGAAAAAAPAAARGGAAVSTSGGGGGGSTEAAAPDACAVNKRCDALVKSAPVMLFMKGTPDAPRCGFSRKVVDVLRDLGVQYGHYDILSDNAVREGLKAYSNWPTFPQLYAGGELVGGCDIVLEMAEGGELKEALDEMTSRLDTA